MHRLGAARTIALAAALLGSAVNGDAAGLQATVSGTVVDVVNGEAIAGATVVVDASMAPVVTGPDGRFSFPDLPPGEYLMRFGGPGYAERVDTLRVFRPGSMDVRVTLTPTPYALDPIAVESSPSPFLARTGFYRRRNAGIGGIFLDRAAIERRQVTQFTELFREIPGAVVRAQGMGTQLIRFSRAMGYGARHPDGCIPDLYVDGLVTGGRPGEPKLTTHDVVDPSHIEAIEVYVGATTPIQYRAACGVILVWTRHR